jgi:hypothetical protein
MQIRQMPPVAEATAAELSTATFELRDIRCRRIRIFLDRYQILVDRFERGSRYLGKDLEKATIASNATFTRRSERSQRISLLARIAVFATS